MNFNTYFFTASHTTKMTTQHEICEKSMVVVKDWMKEFKIHEKSYQQEAMRWAITKEQGFYKTIDGSYKPTKKSGLIADEMGLGKTIMMLGLWVGNFKRNTLIVVPSALLNQWNELIHKWLGSHALVFHGHSSKKSIEEIKESHIVLTTYGMISTRKSSWSSPLWEINWDRVIYDEAHHLRNQKSNKHKGAVKIKSECQWFMTGTPIQNSDKDLKSLCKLMGIWKEIEENHEDAVEILRPYVMMRSKKDVGIKLKPYEETVINIDKYDSEEERQMLREVHSKLGFTNVTVDNVNEVMRFMGGESPLPMLTRARQSCVLPSMITTHIDKQINMGMIPSNVNNFKSSTNTKMRMLTEKINEEKNAGNRSLIFCHYVQEMNIMADILKNKYKLNIETLNGQTSAKNRKIIPTLSPDVLMVQIQSCCEGLNLQQFSTVFFTSPHWNPAVEDQAVARAHRIGQTKQVKVFKYIISGLGADKASNGTLSLDQYCINIQEKKRETMKQFQNDNKRVCVPE